MPNFDIAIVSGIVPTRWADDRILHRAGNTHVYRRVVAPEPSVLAEVVLQCRVGGSFLLDGALGGNLFVPARLAWSGSFPFSITQPTPGASATILLQFSATMLGHQELLVRRNGGGAIILSFEVE